MRTPQFAARTVRILAVPLLVAGIVAPVTAAAAQTRPPEPAASFAITGQLFGVAATSAGNAWAVGTGSGAKTLILRWNGTFWRRVPSPSPAGGAALAGVAATSAINAWAVGSSGTGKTLIERWNGKTWTQVPSPSPGRGQLFGVAATSAGSAWAVGLTLPSSGPGKTLILRWNGKTWK